jgi:hypothetical protein
VDLGISVDALHRVGAFRCYPRLVTLDLAAPSNHLMKPFLKIFASRLARSQHKVNPFATMPIFKMLGGSAPYQWGEF